jgi:predicted dehydrogenase
LTVKVGVVGVGYLGRHHARIYSELEGVELTSIADIDAGKADEISSQYGSNAYSDYRRIVDDVEAVSIVTPTSLHYEIAMHFLDLGKDVLIEKPITTSVSDAEAIIRVAEEKGCIVQVGHLERFNPAVVAVAEFVEDPVFFESERVSPFLGRALDVDVTLDLMIHDIDIVMSLLNGAGVSDFRVVGAKVLTDKIDVAKAWIEFTDGTTALITASRISGEKQRKLKIYQKDSFVMLDYQKMMIKRYLRSDDGIVSEDIDVMDKEPLKEELADFIDCVRTRRSPRVSAQEGRDALEVALGISEKINNSGGRK